MNLINYHYSNLKAIIIYCLFLCVIMNVGDKMNYSTKDLYLARFARITDIVYNRSTGSFRQYYERLDNYVFVRRNYCGYYDIFTKTEYNDLSDLNHKGDIIICDLKPITINRKKVPQEVLERIIEERNTNLLIIKENPLENIKKRILKK